MPSPETVAQTAEEAGAKPHCYSTSFGSFCPQYTTATTPIKGLALPGWLGSIGLAIFIWALIYLIIKGYKRRWPNLLAKRLAKKTGVDRPNAVTAQAEPLFIADDPRLSYTPPEIVEEDYAPDEIGDEAPVRMSIVKTTCWIWLAIVVSIIWFDSLYHVDASWKIWVRLIFGALIPPAILFIEGIELALIALEDKAFEDVSVQKILDEYEAVEEAYMRAREWCLAALIVLLTVIVEFDKYYVPFSGYAEGWIVRSTITFVLASMVVIWVAQSPGKELGKKTPLEFLCGGRLPELTMSIHRVLVKLASLTEVCQIDRPTRVAYRLLRRLLRLPKPKGELPPGGNRFFSELIRRYRYGECNVAEKVTINNDGSALFEQREMVYVGKGFSTYTRLLFCVEPFIYLPTVECSAYRVRRLDVQIERSIERWNRGEGLADEIEILDNHRSVTWHTADHKAIAITVHLPDAMKLDEEHGILLKVFTTAHHGPNSFCGPETPGADWSERKLAKPCFRATTDYVFAQDSGPARIQDVQLRVLQTHGESELPHPPETENYQKLLARRDRQLGRHDGVSPDKRTLRVELQFGLPGATYRVDWEVKRIALLRDASH